MICLILQALLQPKYLNHHRKFIKLEYLSTINQEYILSLNKNLNSTGMHGLIVVLMVVGVGVWGCPISSRIRCMTFPFLALDMIMSSFGTAVEATTNGRSVVRIWIVN